MYIVRKVTIPTWFSEDAEDFGILLPVLAIGFFTLGAGMAAQVFPKGTVFCKMPEIT